MEAEERVPYTEFEENSHNRDEGTKNHMARMQENSKEKWKTNVTLRNKEDKERYFWHFCIFFRVSFS